MLRPPRSRNLCSRAQHYNPFPRLKQWVGNHQLGEYWGYIPYYTMVVAIFFSIIPIHSLYNPMNPYNPYNFHFLFHYPWMKGCNANPNNALQDPESSKHELPQPLTDNPEELGHPVGGCNSLWDECNA